MYLRERARILQEFMGIGGNAIFSLVSQQNKVVQLQMTGSYWRTCSIHQFSSTLEQSET